MLCVRLLLVVLNECVYTSVFWEKSQRYCTSTDAYSGITTQGHYVNDAMYNKK